MQHHILSGWWADAGTIPSLYRASGLVRDDRDNPVLNGLGIRSEGLRGHTWE